MTSNDGVMSDELKESKLLSHFCFPMVMLCLTPREQAQFDLLASIGLHKYLVEF